MGKYKENPKYKVLSIRLTDEEKAFMDKMMRDTNKSVSMLMREAMHSYTLYINEAANHLL
jgi:predicted transcriptional regulator